jgi:DNA-binding HxlR family transcriptional regulator
MTRRTYGQYCGIARALELVGERWALLIVRDLLGGPKRYTDLRRSLRGIPTNVLASRLRELQASGVVERRLQPSPSGAVVYALSSYGRELEDVLLRLGRWGTISLPSPENGSGYVDPSIRALRGAFRPEMARAVHANYQVRFGQFAIHVMVAGDSVTVDHGEIPAADLEIDVRGSILPVLTGDISPSEALESGRVRINGESELFEQFVELFRMRE